MLYLCKKVRIMFRPMKLLVSMLHIHLFPSDSGCLLHFLQIMNNSHIHYIGIYLRSLYAFVSE